MRIKVVAHTCDEEGSHFPGEYLDMRDATAALWVKRGWAIAIPEEKKPEPVVERRVIETPEDGLPEQETATVKRRKK